MEKLEMDGMEYLALLDRLAELNRKTAETLSRELAKRLDKELTEESH